MKKNIFILLALIMPMFSYAYDAEVNGIYYYLDKVKKTATVTYSNKYNTDYSGIVVIPKEIAYENTKYRVIAIYNETFSGCIMLTSVTIPESVTSIGYSAFYGCSKLTSISIPKSVTSVGYNAFDGTGWYNLQPNGLLYLDKWLLGYKNEYPKGELIINEDTRNIADCAFQTCTGLSSVIFPNSILTIGSSAFSGCSGLNTINIPNSVVSIGSGAFDETGWYKDQSEGLLYLDNWLVGFKGEKPKGDLIIPDGTRGIASIPQIIFEDITSLSIPKSVFYIGRNVFFDCSSLSSIIVEEGNENYDSRDNCNAIIEKTSNELILGCKNTIIPNNVVSIGDYAFEGALELNSLSIPNSVTTIGHGAFDSCGFTSIDIPNSVSTLGDYVCGYCKNLVSVNIPSTVSYVGRFAFTSCESLSSISIPSSITKLEDGLLCYCSSLSSVTIPNSVTSIGDDVFQGCTSLASISIPNSVKSIGERAFSYCSSLESILIPRSVNSIGSQIVSYCDNLSQIVVENDNKTYDSRENSNTINEKNTNTIIAGCKNSVIPNSVTSIGDYAFWGCLGLSSINIPINIKTIGNYAFYQCNDLTSVIIPNSISSIEYYTFGNCKNLTTVTIPNSITFINHYAFAKCKNLKDVFCYPKNVPLTYPAVFERVELSNVTLYVPAGSIDLYKNQDPWNKFGNIVALEATKIDNIKDSDNIYEFYNLNGIKFNKPQKGINIYKTGSGKTKKVYLK